MSTAVAENGAAQNQLVPANTNQAAPNRPLVVDTSEFANLMDTSRFEHLWRVSSAFAKSALVPAHFQNKPEDCFVACSMAIRLGVNPFMFMQNTYIVQGKPGMEAKLAIALINTSGVFAGGLRYERVGDDVMKPDYRCRAWAVRADTQESVHGPWITWDIVNKEGWSNKGGSKWKTIPALMFDYRAATWFGRLYCPERLMGMQTADEIEDVVSSPTAEPRTVSSAISSTLGKLRDSIPRDNGSPVPSVSAATDSTPADNWGSKPGELIAGATEKPDKPSPIDPMGRGGK